MNAILDFASRFDFVLTAKRLSLEKYRPRHITLTVAGSSVKVRVHNRSIVLNEESRSTSKSDAKISTPVQFHWYSRKWEKALIKHIIAYTGTAGSTRENLVLQVFVIVVCIHLGMMIDNSVQKLTD